MVSLTWYSLTTTAADADPLELTEDLQSASREAMPVVVKVMVCARACASCTTSLMLSMARTVSPRSTSQSSLLAASVSATVVSSRFQPYCKFHDVRY